MQQGEYTNSQLNGWFKFMREGSQNLIEANALFKESKYKFTKANTALNKQKQKLYNKQDVNVWGTNPADINEAQRSMHDPSKAFKFILPTVFKSYP